MFVLKKILRVEYWIPLRRYSELLLATRPLRKPGALRLEMHIKILIKGI